MIQKQNMFTLQRSYFFSEKSLFKMSRSDSHTSDFWSKTRSPGQIIWKIILTNEGKPWRNECFILVHMNDVFSLILKLWIVTRDLLLLCMLLLRLLVIKPSLTTEWKFDSWLLYYFSSNCLQYFLIPWFVMKSRNK